MEISYDNLQVECGLSDLEILQLQDAQYLAAMEMARRASEETYQVEKKMQVSRQHLDEVLIAINKKTSLHFEQFCCIIVRGYSRPCGSCMVHRNFKDEQDPIQDYCPHLICSEWRLLPELRSISKAFWKKFRTSRVGKSLKICLIYRSSFNRQWTNFFAGYSRKIHSVRPYSIVNYDCPCTDCERIRHVMTKWLRLAGLDPNKNLVIY